MNDAHIADLQAQHAAYVKKHPERAAECARELAKYGVEVDAPKPKKGAD
jgi:uncharacterized protein with GYD domain